MLRVSALMPVRNDEAHVGAAIHSLARQTLSDFELIVIDDGSTDRTCDIVREWAARDARVKLVRLSRHLGLGASLNFGMSMCRAPLVAYCPADTVNDPTRFERQVAWLTERQFTALVGGGARVLDETGAVAKNLRPSSSYEQIRAALVHGETLVGASMTWRRREIEAIGMLATDPDVAGAELYELAVRVAARHPIENVPESLCMITRATSKHPAADEPTPAVQHVRALAGQMLAGVAAIAGPETLPPPATSVRPSQTRHRPRGRIFVVIACYRDRELAPTITDLFARASYPGDITVGVCLQYDPAVDDPRCANITTNPDQVQIVHAHRRESLGLGWARNVSERLWGGEEYVLQIDAHMRFADAWDERLIDQLAACDSSFPVLTTYPCRYIPPRQLKHMPPPRMAARHFTDQGILLLSATAAGPAAHSPTPHAFFAGGFAFYPGAMLREVPSDPFMYFNATEPTHMVRAWTHGWDFFAPSENLVYHLYAVDTDVKAAHWRDRPDWNVLAARGQKRARHLLGMETTFDLDALHALDVYGLGRVRRLEDYQQFSGVDFRARRVSDQAREGRVNPRHQRPRQGAATVRAAGSS